MHTECLCELRVLQLRRTREQTLLTIGRYGWWGAGQLRTGYRVQLLGHAGRRLKLLHKA